MSIAAQSSKKREAWEFLKFLVSEEGERMINADGANIPSRRSVVFSDDFLRHHTTPSMNNRVFLEELPHSVPWPFEEGAFVTHYTLQSQLDLAMRRILLGRATVMQSLKMMEVNVNASIATQRHVAQPKEFAGSFLFYCCCAVPLIAGAVIWTRSGRKHAQEP
jgi:multiple sugar transport system substrate-binding protein